MYDIITTNKELLDRGINKIILYKVSKFVSCNLGEEDEDDYITIDNSKEFVTHAIIYTMDNMVFVLECPSCLSNTMEYHNSSNSIPNFIFEWILLNPDKLLTNDTLNDLIIEKNKV